MIPRATARRGILARIASLFRRDTVTLYCAHCGRACEGQRTREFKRQRTVCGGSINFAGPGERPAMLCMGFRKVSR